MPVKVTTMGEGRYSEDVYPDGKTLDVREGHLLVRGVVRSVGGTGSLIGVYPPGRWITAQVGDADPA
jgi:hypothetical protein